MSARQLTRDMAKRQKKREHDEKERAIRRDKEEFDRCRQLIELKYRSDSRTDNINLIIGLASQIVNDLVRCRGKQK